jgi:hypothetical protein
MPVYTQLHAKRNTGKVAFGLGARMVRRATAASWLGTGAADRFYAVFRLSRKFAMYLLRCLSMGETPDYNSLVLGGLGHDGGGVVVVV